MKWSTSKVLSKAGAQMLITQPALPFSNPIAHGFCPAASQAYRSSRWARGRGDGSAALPHPQTQPGVFCSCTPTTWSFHGPWQDSLSQWEAVLSLSLPGTAKSDTARDLPRALLGSLLLPRKLLPAGADRPSPQQLTPTAGPAPHAPRS